jgi:hypothetical protein
VPQHKYLGGARAQFTECNAQPSLHLGSIVLMVRSGGGVLQRRGSVVRGNTSLAQLDDVERNVYRGTVKISLGIAFDVGLAFPP